jgi:cyclic pyranopterin phosphate synthase
MSNIMLIMSQQFTHLDENDQPQMVDISAKKSTQRIAKARSIVLVDDAILELLAGGDIQTKKGPVFQTAILAGIMAAKKTSELIPLCHPVGMEDCRVEIEVNEEREIVIDCTAKVSGKTGVEMEALTGASVAALTIYDMCKAFSHNIIIKETKLMEKTGGKSDFRRER